MSAMSSCGVCLAAFVILTSVGAVLSVRPAHFSFETVRHMASSTAFIETPTATSARLHLHSYMNVRVNCGMTSCLSRMWTLSS